MFAVPLKLHFLLMQVRKLQRPIGRGTVNIHELLRHRRCRLDSTSGPSYRISQYQTGKPAGPVPYGSSVCLQASFARGALAHFCRGDYSQLAMAPSRRCSFSSRNSRARALPRRCMGLYALTPLVGAQPVLVRSLCSFLPHGLVGFSGLRDCS